MNYYCTKCSINWARLYSEDAGDDTYEFCPKCKNDMYLVDGPESPAYIMNPITCYVIDIKTGRALFEGSHYTVIRGSKEYFESQREWEMNNPDPMANYEREAMSG